MAMATKQQHELPPSVRKGIMGRRRRPGREPTLVWWMVFTGLGLAALWWWSWRILLIELALWCLYEVAIVPKDCKVQPNGAPQPCGEPVRGRAFGCGKAHQEIKNDALWRLTGLRGNPLRRQPPTDPNRDTGELVWSPDVRGRMDGADRTVLVLAAVGTVLTVAGMAFGLTSG